MRAHQAYLHHIPTMFVDLPLEVALQIFLHLLSQEAQTLLEHLDRLRPHPNAARYSDLVYTRLYSGHLVVSVSEVTPPVFDMRLTPQEFERLTRDPRFLAQTPRILEFIFVRSLRDYTQFQASLALLREVMQRPGTCEWLARVSRISFQLNGRSTSDYAPTLLLALVIQTMVQLAGVANVHTLKINSTDIGQCFPDKWGIVFGQYLQLKVLALSDNLLRLDQAGFRLPLFETHFCWPPALRVLVLNKNMLSTFTRETAARLPDSLVELDMSGNQLACIGEPPYQPFAVADVLPNLRVLNLSFNPYLVRLNPDLFHGAGHMRHVLTVHLDGCNIVDRHLLKARARMERVKLYW